MQRILKTEDACTRLITEHLSVTAVVSINYFLKAAGAVLLHRPAPSSQPGVGEAGALVGPNGRLPSHPGPGGPDSAACGVDSSGLDSPTHSQTQESRVAPKRQALFQKAAKHRKPEAASLIHSPGLSLYC